MLSTINVDTEGILLVPDSVTKWIKVHCNPDDERNQIVHYWISTSPKASWTWLAGWLHFFEKEAAVASLKGYIDKAPGKLCISLKGKASSCCL